MIWMMSSEIFSSHWCLIELKTAIENEIPIILVRMPDAFFGKEKVRLKMKNTDD